VPGRSPVKVQPEILGIFFLGEMHVVYVDRGTRVMNVTWIEFDPLAFILHFLNQFGFEVGWFALCVKQWLDPCPWLVLQYRLQRLLW
jgi:hypothetical protein